MSNGSFGDAIRNFFRGVVSLLTTGSWQVEEWAENARSADAILDRMPEEVDLRAQQVLDDINEGITAFAGLEMKAQRYRDQAADWQSKAEKMASQARANTEGTPERHKYEELARAALAEKLKAEDLLAAVESELAAARPEYEEALKAVEQIGFDRESALSQVERLRVSNASAEARIKLARAHREWTQAGAPGAMLTQAQAKVDESLARARAEQEIESALPPSASQVTWEMSRMSRDQRIDEEMTRLMGGQR
jgi:phage shock protein A